MQHLEKVLHSLTYFQEVKMIILKTDLFSFPPGFKERECVTVIIACRLYFNLGTIQ